MKKIFILLIFPILLLSCSKNGYMNTATIEGEDKEKCDCCGVWLINIDDHILKFIELPENSNLDLDNATFPLKVKLNWKYVDELKCSREKIDVLEIVKY